MSMEMMGDHYVNVIQWRIEMLLISGMNLRALNDRQAQRDELE